MAAKIWLALLWLMLIVCSYAKMMVQDDSTVFDENYGVLWGGDHVMFLDGGREVHLQMDNNSGSGFDSKLAYASGFFHMRIKVPSKDSAGVVTAFYLSSQNSNGQDELDFEFLGNREGLPYTLQTNVFINGNGGREQRIHLWFDPTADFHAYKVLWNAYQIVFFVDDFPIRVFRNDTSSGAGYPSQPMKVIGSLWNGEDWATDGGKTKIDWTQAPFTASFRGFGVDGCPSGWGCSARAAWWNSQRFSGLSSAHQHRYEQVKEKYMNYDYCSDRARYPAPPPECPQ